MPYRAVYLGVGVLGVVVVLLLLFFRADLRRHCVVGPRWKRRLVSAGLMLLGATGFGADLGCTKKAQPGPTPNDKIEQPAPDEKPEVTPVEKPKPKPQAETEPWKSIEQTTSAAREVAAGKKGQYPFDRVGRKKMIAALDDAIKQVGALATDGKINKGEAGLWQEDLKLLRSRVWEFRPTEMKTASCYEPMPMIIPAKQSLERIQARLPLLGKMVEADKLHPGVARKVLVQIDKDLAVLSSAAELKKLRTDKDRKLAKKYAKAAQMLVGWVRGALAGKLSPGAVKGQDPRWARVAGAWAALEASIKKSTKAEREVAGQKLEAAMAAVDELLEEGKLSKTAAQLLRDEGKSLTSAMYRKPHSDFRGKCYKRKRFIAAEGSMERVNKRLPLLKKLVASGKISPGVVKRIVPAMERDLRVLSDEMELKQMDTDADRKKARKAEKRARKMLKQIKKLGPRE